jgi:hypothetical protein
MPERQPRRDVGVGDAASDRHPKQVEIGLRDAGHDRADPIQRWSDGTNVIDVDPAAASPVAKLAAQGVRLPLIPARDDHAPWETRCELCGDTPPNDPVAADDEEVAPLRHARFVRHRCGGDDHATRG